jgi:hypothetical protein
MLNTVARPLSISLRFRDRLNDVGVAVPAPSETDSTPTVTGTLRGETEVREFLEALEIDTVFAPGKDPLSAQAKEIVDALSKRHALGDARFEEIFARALEAPDAAHGTQQRKTPVPQLFWVHLGSSVISASSGVQRATEWFATRKAIGPK